jgi:hypothetical protein
MARIGSVLLWLVALAGAGVGTLFFVLAVMGSNGAPQETAGAAMACAIAVLPYVAARAWDELSGVNRPDEYPVRQAVHAADPPTHAHRVLTEDEARRRKLTRASVGTALLGLGAAAALACAHVSTVSLLVTLCNGLSVLLGALFVGTFVLTIRLARS